MRALVIGADGFAGRWLTRHLIDIGDEVVAGVGPHFVGGELAADEVVAVDVTDAAALGSAIQAGKPDVTYYLAGVSSRENRDAVGPAIAVTITGSVATLAALSEHAPGSRLLFVSTAQVYQSSPEPQDESAPAKPADAYGTAKLAAEKALSMLAGISGIRLAIARPFNHIGPGQREGFLVPTVAGQLRDVAKGDSTKVSVGAVDDVLDFSDVRDVVRAYRLIATSGEPGIWNVASGKGRLVKELIDQMVELADSEAEVIAATPASYAGPRTLIGDATKLRGLGWGPEHNLTDTLRDVLDTYLPTKHVD